MMSRYQAYGEYKDSGVEWLGNLPINWGARQLKFLCTCNDEVLGESVGEDFEIEYVDIGSVSASEGISKTETMIFGSAPSRARRVVKNGDVIISTVRTYLEAIAAIDNPPPNMIVSTGFAVIRPNQFLHKGYAAYCLRASGFIKEVIARSVGVSYPAINASDLINIKTPEPSYVEQQTIANFLDHETAKIDALIAKQQELIKLLKEKRQAVISHAVTKGLNPNAPMRDSGVEWLEKMPVHWGTSKVRYMFSFGKGLTITKDNLQDEGVPCVNYGEVHSRYGFEVDPAIHSLKCVSEQYLISSQNSLLSKGDLIYADTSEDIEGSGNFTQLIVDQTVFAGYHTIIVRPNDRKSYRFYAYLFDSKELRTQIRHAVKGVKVFSITQAILRGIDIWLPPIEERENIANFLDHETAKIDALIAKQQELIKLLKEKRQAVISHAVTGKIDVRNWQPVFTSDEAVA